MAEVYSHARQFLIESYEHSSDYLKQYNPVLLTVFCVSSTYVACQLWAMHRDDIGIRKRVKTRIFNFIKSIPVVRKQIDIQLADVKKELTSSLVYKDGPKTFITQLPEHGIEQHELFELAKAYDEMETPRYLEGRVSGAVFSDESNDKEMAVYLEVFRRFAWSNPLWPKLFPGVRKMESEIIRMCCNLMNGDSESCGTMSTGGTMSILLACLAHRNRALKRGVLFPEMVIPTSVHAAFTKAAEVFRIKVVKVPVDPVTYRVDLNKMRASITPRTCMLVGSAPNFPYGTVDDIPAIGELGIKHDIPVHVDACLGGFLLPFLTTDYQWDFRVPGVCSISADTHKYGLTPKGSSVVLYRSADYLHNQYFCDPDWQGGIYASSTLEGSRAGVNIALCWASLLFQGQEKYRQYAEDVLATTKAIRAGISSIRGLKLLGSDDVCIVSWTTENGLDIHRFHHEMSQKKWQLSGLQFPSGVHIMVTLNHTKPGVAEKLISDCQEAVNFIRNSPPTESDSKSEAAIYGMSQSIPDRSIVNEFANAYLDATYNMIRQE